MIQKRINRIDSIVNMKTTAPSDITEIKNNPPTLFRIVIIAIIYLSLFIILDIVSYQFEELSGIVAWYPPVGLTYAFLLVFGARFTPVVTIALLFDSFLIYHIPQPFYLKFLWAIVISLIYAWAATFLRKRIHSDRQFGKLDEVIWFIGTTIIISILLTVLTVTPSTFSSDVPLSEFFRANFHWWIGETVGVLSITPFLLIYVLPYLKQFAEGQGIALPKSRPNTQFLLTSIAQGAILIIILYWVFGVKVLVEYQPLYLLALPLIWIGLSRGIKGISIGLLVLNFGIVIAQWLFKMDYSRMGELQLLMILYCIVSLLMGAVVTDRKIAEDKMRVSEEKYRFLTEFASDVIWILNISTNKFTYISPSVYQFRGYTVEEAMQGGFEDALTPESLENVKIEHAKNMQVFLQNPNISTPFITEMQQPCKNGETIWVETSTKFRYNSTGDIEVVGVSRNIDARKKAEKEVLYLSYHDPLTGLYNRRYFDNEMKRINELNCSPLTLVMADVNGLKLVNDAFGHQAGDILLEKFAQILQKECRSEDIIARIGGDEFVLLLPETDLKNAEKIIYRINKAIAREKIENVVLSISIGSAVKLDDTVDIAEVFKEAEDKMYRQKLSNSSSLRSKSLDIIMKTLYEKSKREMQHSNRVSSLCAAIATQMNLDNDDINQVRIAGLMHDIGKIGIDEDILNKPGVLSGDEWKEIERHPEIGYRILSSVIEFSMIAEDVLQHHEKWNGKGYPRGLKGEEISLQARIIAIADAYDGMTGERTYSKPMSELEAIKEIRKCSGTQFSPEITKIFIEMVLNKKDEVIINTFTN